MDFNQIASVAASLQDLAKSREAPVFIEGDVIVEVDGKPVFLDMDDGEAARKVVEAVLAHPYVQEMLNERDLLWEALKWLVANVSAVPLPPNEHVAVIESAITASGWDEDHPVTP